MNTLLQFCPHETCSARGQSGQGTIVIHDRQRQRYRCRTCGHTFSARRGTMLEGLRKPTELIVIVVSLLAYGCPIQAMVHAYGLDERTVARWRDRAGEQSERVHQARVVQPQWDLQHVQADEVRAKGRGMVVWMAMARNGLDAFVVGWGGECEARSSSGGSAADAGAGLCIPAEAFVGLYGRLGTLPQEHPADLS